jgi:hypothetical protein
MLPVDQDDYRQSDCRLCCCHGDYENGEYLACQSLRIYEFGKSHEIYIYCIEQKLDRHQDTDGISPGQDPEYPYAEEQST